MADYKKVKVEAGPSGWGGPLEIQPTEKEIYCLCNWWGYSSCCSKNC